MGLNRELTCIRHLVGDFTAITNLIFMTSPVGKLENYLFMKKQIQTFQITTPNGITTKQNLEIKPGFPISKPGSISTIPLNSATLKVKKSKFYFQLKYIKQCTVLLFWKFVCSFIHQGFY